MAVFDDDLYLLLELAEAGAEDIDVLPNGLAFFSVVSTIFLSLTPSGTDWVIRVRPYTRNRF